MKLGTEVGLGPSHIVLDGDLAPLPQKGHNPQFSVHVCCGQTAGWIKMPLGTKVGLGPGDIVLDGVPAPPPPKKRGDSSPFRPMYCDRTAGWINMPLETEVGLRAGHIVLDGTRFSYAEFPRKRSTERGCPAWMSMRRQL